MKRLFDRIFGRAKETASDSIEAVPPVAQHSEARDAFYEDIRAQQEAKADDIILGEDEMSDEDRMNAARIIVQVNPKESVSVVEKGDDWEDGLVSAQDAASAQEMFEGDSKSNDGRYADIWATFARINPRILRHFVSRAFIGYPACTILGTHEIINPCCAMPGEDAMSPGYKLTCFSDKHEECDEHLMEEDRWLCKIRKMADRMGLNKVCTDLSFYTRLYGIGVAVPRVELKSGHTMEEPYDPMLIKEGTYRGFSVVDPQRFTWDLTEETLYDPLSEFYMKPEYIRLYNREDTRIHRSWCVVCYFREVGDDLKGTYMWGGVPLSQMLYERVFCADKLANEIVALAMSKRTVVKDGNMKAMINNAKATDHMIQRWNGYRNNQAIAFKEPGEQITQLETSLSDLQPLSAQQYQYAAAIAGIPVTKLLKNVPSGLQATGQYEQDEYEQTLKAIQEQYYRPLLEKHYELYIRSSYPEREDLAVEVTFNPIQLPKASEVQQMAQGRGSMVSQLLQQSVITITEARAILKSGDSPLFSVLAAETPELLQKIESMKDPEEQQKMQMQAQMGAMGGGGMPQGGQGGPEAQGGQAGQPENPEYTQTKDMFAQAIKEVLGGNGGEQQSPGDNGGQVGAEGQEGSQPISQASPVEQANGNPTEEDHTPSA